jgi:phage-related protein
MVKRKGGLRDLTGVGKYDNVEAVDTPRGDDRRKTRPVSWIGAALREFETFPEGARSICLAALTIAAERAKADIAKPMQGMGSGVFEIALPFRGDAYRVIYAVQLAEEIWVVHAFQKKSTKGTKTPKREIDLVKERLKRLKEMLR